MTQADGTGEDGERLKPTGPGRTIVCANLRNHLDMGAPESPDDRNGADDKEMECEECQDATRFRSILQMFLDVQLMVPSPQIFQAAFQR